MSSKKPLREIAVQQSVSGMFVVKMDISWLDNPFFSHTREIASDEDIALLIKAGATKVVIDPNKGLDVVSDNE